MNFDKFVHQIHQQLNDAFLTQDPELLDLCVEIEGKKIYADKLRLSVMSTTFKSMLSDRWTSKDEPIKITGYKYDDFKEFITFLYSGYCNLNDENIFTMIDIAEYYQVPYFKQLCDEYMAKKDFVFENLFEYIELSNKYSLLQTKKSLQIKVFERKFTESNKFLNAKKSAVHEMAALNPKPEKLFQAVYQWSEHQALKKQEKSNDLNFNKNAAIKAEISGFLPHIDFKKMEKMFLIQYVAKRTFIFSDDQLIEISDSLNPEVKFKVTNSLGQSLTGTLLYETNEAEIEIIKSLQNCYSEPDLLCIYWKTKCKIPTHPISIQRKPGVKFYLTYFWDGDIGLRSCYQLFGGEYLITEMTANGPFGFSTKCTIEIV